MTEAAGMWGDPLPEAERGTVAGNSWSAVNAGDGAQRCGADANVTFRPFYLVTGLTMARMPVLAVLKKLRRRTSTLFGEYADLEKRIAAKTLF